MTPIWVRVVTRHLLLIALPTLAWSFTPQSPSVLLRPSSSRALSRPSISRALLRPSSSHVSMSVAPTLLAAGLAGTAAANLIAGGIAGAIGVGAAYPLDTVKVKMQSYSSRRGAEAVALAPLEVVKRVLDEEGIRGFYSGVQPTMAAQFFIKAITFVFYEGIMEATDNNVFIAGSVCGIVCSLINTPLERVKVVMQAAESDVFDSPLQCAQKLVQQDGIFNAFYRGYGVTLLREIPGTYVYFQAYESVSYAISQVSPGAPSWVAPLIGGAMAGAIGWISIYPVDVVKTSMQIDLDGGRRENMVDAAMRLWKKGGPGIFWDGITPKVMRAFVNHGVTFLVFEELNAALLAGK